MDCNPEHLVLSTIEINDELIGLLRLWPQDYWPPHLTGRDETMFAPVYSRWTSQGDGMIRFTMSDGLTALYGFAHNDPESTRPGSTCNHWDLISEGVVEEPTVM